MTCPESFKAALAHARTELKAAEDAYAEIFRRIEADQAMMLKLQRVIVALSLKLGEPVPDFGEPLIRPPRPGWLKKRTTEGVEHAMPDPRPIIKA